MYQWLKLLRLLLVNQQQVLEEAAKGDLSVRVPVVQHGEMGAIAHYTNEMLIRLEKSYDEVNLTRDVAIVGLSAWQNRGIMKREPIYCVPRSMFARWPIGSSIVRSLVII